MIGIQYEPLSPFKVKVTGPKAWVEVGFEGETYRAIDFRSGYWHRTFGYGYPGYREIINDPSLYHPAIFESGHGFLTALDKKIAEVFGNERWVHFVHNGTEANDTALRIADSIHPDGTIVSLEYGFYGTDSATKSASGFPNTDRPTFVRQDRFVKVRDDESGIEQIRQMAKHNQLCAVLVELVKGVAGAVVIDQKFLHELTKIREEFRNFLIIVDEVTSLGITSSLLTTKHMGVLEAVDIVTLAKGVSGGYGDVGLTVSTMNTYTSYCQAGGRHQFGRTTGGRPLHCALVLHTLQQYQDWGRERIRQMVNVIDNQIARHNIPSRGLGIFRAIDCGKSKKAEELSVKLLCKHGFYVRKEGRYLLLRPPLVVSDDDIARFFKVIKILV